MNFSCAITKITIAFLSLMLLCCFSCDPEPYQPECMNGFICYAYTPSGADSVRMDLFYEDLLVESETHHAVVGLPDLKHSFNQVEVQISVFCNGNWLSSEKIEVSKKSGIVKNVMFDQIGNQSTTLFTEEQVSVCPSLSTFNVHVNESSDRYCDE